jgi:arsenate reductase
MKRLHIHIAVEQLEESIRFYSAMFQVGPTVREADYAKWMLDDPRVNFAISSRGAKAGLDHLGIQVESGEELETVRKGLAAAALPVEAQTKAACCYAESDKYWTMDPQGIPWEAFHTFASIPVFGRDEVVKVQPAKACCAPTPGHENTPLPVNKPLNVLILCTGNSCRSILGEALLNHLGRGRLQAFSAGSHPVGKVNANALATLARHGLPTEGYRSQSWDEFEDAAIDIMISVCDSAAGEACPAYLGRAVRGHWGLPDPAHVQDSAEEVEAAFEATYTALERRIHKLMALPIERLSKAELAEVLNQIGTETL